MAKTTKAVLNVNAIRRLRKEIETRLDSYRRNFDYESFDKETLSKALTKKYAKELTALGLTPLNIIGALAISMDGNVYFRTRDIEDAINKLINKGHPALKKAQAEFKAALDKHDSMQPRTKAKQLVAKLRDLEVECLINTLSTDDPKVMAVFNEARALLTSDNNDE